jgi:hypothetical protein
MTPTHLIKGKLEDNSSAGVTETISAKVRGKEGLNGSVDVFEQFRSARN